MILFIYCTLCRIWRCGAGAPGGLSGQAAISTFCLYFLYSSGVIPVASLNALCQAEVEPKPASKPIRVVFLGYVISGIVDLGIDEDASLNAGDVARMLGISAYQLSELLNQVMGTTRKRGVWPETMFGPKGGLPLF